MKLVTSNRITPHRPHFRPHFRLFFCSPVFWVEYHPQFFPAYENIVMDRMGNTINHIEKDTD